MSDLGMTVNERKSIYQRMAKYQYFLDIWNL